MSSVNVTLSPQLRQRFFDANGLPLAGGQLFTYQAGTSTPLATYTDSTGSTPQTNPIVLDADGYCDFWMQTATYKFQLQDVNNNVLWTIDNIQSLAAAIASQINIAGALAAINNLSDLTNVATALKNLGISPYTYPTKFTITNGQSATSLAGETVDGTVYSSVFYQAEVQQGTTIFSNVRFTIQYLNTNWQLIIENLGIDNGTTHGLTFSLTQAGSIAQLKVADSGKGNGTLKLKKSYFLVTP